jgi:hypothetical protein
VSEDNNGSSELPSLGKLSRVPLLPSVNSFTDEHVVSLRNVLSKDDVITLVNHETLYNNSLMMIDIRKLLSSCTCAEELLTSHRRE